MTDSLVSETTKNPKDLLAGDFPTQFEGITVASGEGALVAGTVLGKITASGKYGAYDDGAADGTEVASRILAYDVDATAADVATPVFRTGSFKESKLTGIDANGIADLDPLCIFVR